MACNNCEGSATLGATQGNLTAWVQPGGAGPNNDVFYAMAEAGNWPAIKVTGVSRKRRGTSTPILRRSGVNPRQSVQVGKTVAAKAANTATVQFAEGRCGGFLPNEIMRCLLDVYQQHNCCGEGGDFDEGWSRIDVIAGFDPESDDYSDQTSFVSEEDAALTITHPGEFREKLTIYPLTVAEIAASVGMDVGTQVLDVVYANKESCGDACGGNQGCQDQWYAVTNEGRVIYKKNALAAVASNAIGGYPPSSQARVALLGNKIFVSFRAALITDPGGFYWAELDSDGDPGAWTQVELVVAFYPSRWVKVGNKLILGGYNGVTLFAIAYEIEKSTAATVLFSAGSANTAIRDMIECGGRIVAAGEDGTIWISSCAGVWALAPTTPTSTDLSSISARSLNEWWVTDGGGAAVFYTLDSGNNWHEASFPFSGVAGWVPWQVAWANPNVGYVLVEDTNTDLSYVYATWNGGQSWVNTGVTNFRITTPPTGVRFQRMAIPCCTNPVEQSNAFLIAGVETETTGGLWQASIEQCN